MFWRKPKNTEKRVAVQTGPKCEICGTYGWKSDTYWHDIGTGDSSNFVEEKVSGNEVLFCSRCGMNYCENCAEKANILYLGSSRTCPRCAPEIDIEHKRKAAEAEAAKPAWQKAIEREEYNERHPFCISCGGQSTEDCFSSHHPTMVQCKKCGNWVHSQSPCSYNGICKMDGEKLAKQYGL